MSKELIFDIIQYVGLPLLGVIIKMTWDKLKGTKCGKTARVIVENVEEMIDFNGSSAAGEKLRFAVAKLIDKYTFLTEAQATTLVNKAVYEMNKESQNKQNSK